MRQIKPRAHFAEMYKCNRIQYGTLPTSAIPIPPLNKQIIRYAIVVNLMQTNGNLHDNSVIKCDNWSEHHIIVIMLLHTNVNIRTYVLALSNDGDNVEIM
jgi:hypothetical protein